MPDVPQTVSVGGIHATLFTTSPVPVYLLPNGMFAVLNGRHWEKRTTLKAAVAALRQTATHVTLVALDYNTVTAPDLEIDSHDVVAWNSHGRIETKTRSYAYHTSHRLYHPSSKIVKALGALSKKVAAFAKRVKAEDAKLEAEYERLKEQLTKATQESFYAASRGTTPARSE